MGGPALQNNNSRWRRPPSWIFAQTLITLTDCLWSTYCSIHPASVYALNQLFRKTIFWPLEGAAPRNFYTCQRMTKACRCTPLRGRWYPQQFFLQRVVKIGLKCSVGASITLALGGVALPNYHVMCPRWGC